MAKVAVTRPDRLESSTTRSARRTASRTLWVTNTTAKPRLDPCARTHGESRAPEHRARVGRCPGGRRVRRRRLGRLRRGVVGLDDRRGRSDDRLVIHPVAIGYGTALFSSLAEPLRVELAEAALVPLGHRPSTSTAAETTELERPDFTKRREHLMDRNVLLHGADTAQRCLRAGLLDEMEIHVVPVLLGHGRRLFDDLSADHIDLT